MSNLAPLRPRGHQPGFCLARLILTPTLTKPRSPPNGRCHRGEGRKSGALDWGKTRRLSPPYCSRRERRIRGARAGRASGSDFLSPYPYLEKGEAATWSVLEAQPLLVALSLWSPLAQRGWIPVLGDDTAEDRQGTPYLPAGPGRVLVAIDRVRACCCQLAGIEGDITYGGRGHRNPKVNGQHCLDQWVSTRP